jgi:hypothetical membrane protein
MHSSNQSTSTSDPLVPNTKAQGMILFRNVSVPVRVQLGGTLLVLAGVVILLGIIFAETQYPHALHYSTYFNTISDLGATLPPHSIITQPSADIFDWTMMLTGALLILGAISIHEVHRRKILTILIVLMGLGIVGVGIFPDNHHSLHRLFSLGAFLFGGLAVTFSFAVTERAFRYIALFLGLTSLFFLVLGSYILEVTLGAGGVERGVAYPIVLWMVGYGSYVLGHSKGPGADTSINP